MKRKGIIGLFLIVSLVTIGLFGCSGKKATPSEVTEKFLNAVKAKDTETIKKVYAGNQNGETIPGMNGDSSGGSTDTFDEEIEKMLEDKVLSFDYEVVEENIEGDKATVYVAFKTYKIGEAFTQMFTRYIQQAFGMALSGSSEDELNKVMQPILKEEFDKLVEKDYHKVGSFSLTKGEDGWKIDEIDNKSDAMDAMTGGLVSVLSSFDESFSNLDQTNDNSASTGSSETTEQAQPGITEQEQGSAAGESKIKESDLASDGIIAFSTDAFSVKYDRFEVSKDYDGKPVLLYYYDFQNLSNENLMPSTSVGFTVFQNGIECGTAFLLEAPNEYGNGLKEIQPGASIKVCDAYEITDDSDVTIEGKEYMSFSNEKDTQVISIK